MSYQKFGNKIQLYPIVTENYIVFGDYKYFADAKYVSETTINEKYLGQNKIKAEIIDNRKNMKFYLNQDLGHIKAINE